MPGREFLTYELTHTIGKSSKVQKFKQAVAGREREP